MDALAPLVAESIIELISALPVKVLCDIDLERVAPDPGKWRLKWENMTDWTAPVARVHGHKVAYVNGKI